LVVLVNARESKRFSSIDIFGIKSCMNRVLIMPELKGYVRSGKAVSYSARTALCFLAMVLKMNSLYGKGLGLFRVSC
jgi:hypothetical protein